MLKKKDLKYFPRIQVVGLLIIFAITLSLYTPFWFLRTLRAVNRISSRPKISEKWFVFLLVLIIITLIGELLNSSCPEIRFAKNFIKNSIRPLLIFSTPCGHCPESKTDEKFKNLYFRTV
ncbi:DUF4234 domain-containing protein, partial [Myxococcota bacterium]|nr:DUF4234 domain-containing protein [Myxococcota bacterium]MBU1498277.1 DUF4234 domain-containing protein [Myxococcota bacterium]